ncbi:hypothetical protein ACLOJK_024107 [Asimina triloba]
MLTVTKVTDFQWTRSQRVQSKSKSVTSLRLEKHSPTLIVCGKHVPTILIENGTTLNVRPLRVASHLGLGLSDFTPATQIVRAYNNIRREVIGVVTLQITVGPPCGVSSFGYSVLLKLTLWKTIDPSIQSRALFFASNGEVPLP